MNAETRGNVQHPEADPVVSLGGSIVLFLATCYFSILPATTTCYVLLDLIDPWAALEVTGSWLALAVAFLASIGVSTAVLYLWSWLQAKLAVGLVMGFKEIPEGRFKKSLYDKTFQQFTLRHVVKKFSMWLFKFHAPRCLYRKYAGTFIKLGKHVEVPEWFPMEKCEIGDNTVIARHIVIGSHVIEGDYVTLKNVMIGKNCIIDSGEEIDKRTCVGPGTTIEDDVIVKAGTTIVKDNTLKAGGIYDEDPVIRRVGEVSDLPSGEVERWRKEVLAKDKIKSKMLDDWSSFASRWPRVLDKLASLVGYLAGIGLILAWWFGAAAPLDDLLPPLGPVLNVLILPAIAILGYGFNVFIPIGVVYPVVKRIQRIIPDLEDLDNGGRRAGDDGKRGNAIVITDPTIIETWKCCKWLKWRLVERVMRSLFPDASALIYQRIGRGNEVALKSTFIEAMLDIDNVSLGENSLLSMGAQVYAYSLTDGQTPRLVIKRTTIGRNCIIAQANVMAGASIGDNVLVGLHAFVPEDARLDSDQTYTGNPAVDIKTFMAMKKRARQQMGIGK
ncbi:MAG: hypothetical protein JW839_12570 [Candidatus Lokiarchaeota archaeon]|nr:hypothetical protein [Candidatus Lokiarchaeota archaeon]